MQQCGSIYSVALRLICIATLTIGVASLAYARTVKSLLEMRRENVAVQQWDLSCGAAALTTLLNFQHQDMVTEKQVAIALMGREEYIKNPLLVNIRQGFSLLDLKRYELGCVFRISTAFSSRQFLLREPGPIMLCRALVA